MARQKRLHVPHATYYVIDQFRPGAEVLVAHPETAHSTQALERIAANRQEFEAQLIALTHRWGVHIDAHCWVPDAALFVLKISMVSLEGMMHSLRGTYSHYLHSAGVAGRPHSGRYHARLIDPDEYLLDFSRHVLDTPVRLGLSPSALDYPHNSFSTWLGEARATYLEHSRVPKALANRGFVGRTGLVRFLAERPATGFPSLVRRGSRWDSRIAGTDRFVRETHRNSDRSRQSDSIEPAIRWVADLLGIGLEVVMSGRRSHERTRTLALASWLLTCSGTASLSETARWVSCRKSTLHKDIERSSRSRPDLFNVRTLSRYLEFVAATPVKHSGAARRKRTPAVDDSAL